MGKLYKKGLQMNSKEALVYLFFVLLGATVIFFAPLLVIWSINNIFNTETPYNWKTWISVYILLTIINSSLRNGESNKVKNFWN